MNNLLLSLQPENISMGVSTRIKLGISHGFNGTLHNLTLRVKNSPQIQFQGSLHLRVDQIVEGKTVWVDLPATAKEIGRAIIKVDRLTACLNGKTMEFPEISLVLDIHTTDAFPSDNLRLTCKTTTIQDGKKEIIKLKLMNDSEFLLEDVILKLKSNDLAFEYEMLNIGFLAPHSNREVNVPIISKVAGDVTLALMLHAQRTGKPLLCEFGLPFSVIKDKRAQETHVHGDIKNETNVININRRDKQVVIEEETNNDPDKSLTHQSKLYLGFSEKHTENNKITCPNCGKDVEIGNFCNWCQHEF